ncbi:8583_t:CDS:1 [Ambispora gerdemannii]|uniref:Mannose-P-dolichol utilization defect 1 protein homolog n=1 Tax=Ambispora gerdemannii TaxID=144530 RepID=A0A9N9F058_9GLOM|nr:8583_t:CDS:1 [Ambispora gerdemannii]
MILPSFIQEPVFALIGEECYNSLITNLNISDTQCTKLVFSKALGIGIVLGGSLIKLPQVLKIIANGSARGLSFESYVLETIAYAVGLAYNFRQGNPFSTYGESFFLTIQNIIILLLILKYRGQADRLVVAGLSIVVMSYALNSSSLINDSLLAFLQACSIPLSLAAKIPQIIQNYTNGSTGQLSAFAVFGYTLGSMARVFTTITEVHDPIILAGFSLATLFNAVLALQMVVYWNAVDDAVIVKKKE